MCVLTRGERFKDARTVHNQHGSQSMDEVYSATGISPSMIKDLEDDEKNRSVGYDKIAILAQYYGVSSDFLLGLSPYSTVEKDLEYICKYTGLSEKSVKYLKFLTDIHAGKIVHPKALAEIQEYDKKNNADFYEGYYEYICRQYSESVYDRRRNAERYGVKDEDDIAAIANATIAESKRRDEEFKKWIAENYQRAAALPVAALNAILAADLHKNILNDLSFFLQLNTSQRRDGESSFSVTISSKNDNFGLDTRLPIESISWGFLRKAENSLADLRRELSNELVIDQID